MNSGQPILHPTVELDFLDEGQIAVVTLVDKARSNAMSPEMGDAFRAVVEKLKLAPNLRATVICGQGKDFSIGGARQMLSGLAAPDLSFDARRTFMLEFYQRWLSILEIPVPTIAAIQGECIGIAPIFACAADIAIAEDTTRFQITFTNLGFYPGMALSYLLPRAVNRQHSNWMLIAARPFSGRQAAEAGLVAKSVAPGRLMEEALASAREVAANEPLTTRMLTQALRVTREQLQPALESDGRRQAESYGTHRRFGNASRSTYPNIIKAHEDRLMSQSCTSVNTHRGLLTAICLSLCVIQAASGAEDRAETTALLDARYRALIDAENRHDIDAVRSFVWRSPNTLFVAKTATAAEGGWAGFWGTDTVVEHFRELYRGTFVMRPDYARVKTVEITNDVAETYAPLTIAVSYAGQTGLPKPFLMIVTWVRTPEGWKMATDVALPIPDAAARGS